MKSKVGRRVSADGRSVGQVRHVRLYHWLTDSVAYRALPVGPRAALVELYALFRGDNNGELFMSAREAADRLNTDKNTASRWLWDLEAHGFIRPRQSGAFDWKQGKATTWILTEFPFAGAAPTKDFMRWRPGENLAARPRPGAPQPPPKNRNRSYPAGQTVHSDRTVATQHTQNCPTGVDTLRGKPRSARPTGVDTGSIP